MFFANKKTWLKRLPFLFSVLFTLFVASRAQSDENNSVFLYGQDSLYLGYRFTSSGGDIGTGGDLTIAMRADIIGDVFALGDIIFNRWDVIDGDVYVGGSIRRAPGMAIGGDLIRGTDTVPSLEIPTIEVSPGEEDFIVYEIDSDVLTEGNYGNVVVENDATLILTGGDYHMESLTVGENARLQVNNATLFAIEGAFNFAEDTRITLDSSITPLDFVIYTDSEDESSIGLNSEFEGTVYAPNGKVTLHVGGAGIVEGAFFAKDMVVTRSTTITGVPPCLTESEICDDGIDQDCDGSDLDCLDADQDGDGYTPREGDCGDGDAVSYPGATEVCDGADNDCDGTVDEGVTTTFYTDADGDGFGDPSLFADRCSPLAGEVADNTDCNDTSDQSYPSATEVCDALDNNCDGQTDEDIYACEDGVIIDVPSDPSSVAPDLETTTTTSLGDSVSFLYDGTSGIQDGVDAATIDVTRAAVIRGRVYATDGSALHSVDISILNHDEYGSTQTRPDGMFDLVVNGGGYLTVLYQKDGYLPVQRKVNAPWQDYVWAENVVMMPYDSEVTTVDLTTATDIQVAQGSISSDDDGDRQATLLFSPTTVATMTLADGTTATLSSMDVRATEFTVGENGPNAMPGELPATSAYTYAVALTVDEAVSAGATGVEFSEPVYFYLENFLNFDVGQVVPVGYYDESEGAWKPLDNGIVVEVLGDLTGDGITEIDSDGDGAADDAATLSALNITDAERENITSLYSAGQTLWRASLSHFSLIDMNWPYRLPGDASSYAVSTENNGNNLDNTPNIICSSIIECENQILGESIGVTGTEFSLNYRSDRVPGRLAAYTTTLKVTGDSFPTTLKRIDVNVSIAGQLTEESLTTITTNQDYTYTWDGLDGYGRAMQGEQTANIRIGYVYDGVYTGGAPASQSFGQFGDVTFTYSSRGEYTLWEYVEVTMGTWDGNSQKMGAWTLSNHHVYDPQGQTIYFGNGSRRSASDYPAIIEAVAGTGTSGAGTDGAEALSSDIYNPFGLAVDNEGNVYFTTQQDDRIWKVTTDGVIHVIAGTGTSGYSGDGGAATSARLNNPSGIEVDTEGNIYFTDTNNYAVRKIDTDGIITTIAGTGSAGYSGDGGAATSATFKGPTGITIDREGNIYIADTGNVSDARNHRIRKVDKNGIITSYAGGSIPSFGEYYDGEADGAAFSLPRGLAFDEGGNLYVADSDGNVRKISTDGLVSTIAADYGARDTGDGGYAVDARLSAPYDVAVDHEGNIYIAERSSYRIRQIDSDGIIRTVAGNGTAGSAEEGKPATATNLYYPTAIAFDSFDNLYIADQGYARIYKVQPFLQRFDDEHFIIASADGSEIYEFDENGAHLKTYNALTGATIYTFSYNRDNLLTQITDGDGNITTITRDADGNATAITAPFGQVTTLSINAEDYLETVTSPNGKTTQMTYAGEGLLAMFTDANGNASTLTYDDDGLLTNDENALTGYKALTRATDADEDLYTVVTSTGLGYVTSYGIDVESDGSTIRTFTDTNGLTTTTTEGNDLSTTKTFPDGTVVSTTIAADPRFGMQIPILDSQTTTTPAGRTNTVTVDRSTTLSDDTDVFSLTAQTDTVTINGNVYTNVFNATANQATTTTPEGRVLTTTVDEQGRVTLSEITDLDDVSYTYDSYGRLSTVTQGSRVYTIAYNAQGFVETITDPLLHVTRFDYDTDGHVTKQVLADAREINYTYDDFGNLTSVTPPSKPVHSITYNAANLESTYVAPNIGLASHTTQYDYNQDKQLYLITRPDGKTITLDYDTAGRLDEIATATDSTTLTYDVSTGNLITIATSDGQSLSYGYDGFLLISSSWTGIVSGSVVRTYDNDFRITSRTVSGTTISYDYDNDGLLTNAGDLELTRDEDNGLLIGTTLDSITTRNTYNGFGEIEAFDALDHGTSVYQTMYTRDDAGRITTLSETAYGTTTTYDYTYDDTGRLTNVSKNGAAYASYSYDDNGNRLSHTDETTATTTSGVYDDQDRLTSYGSNVYTYTDNGELLTKTDTSGTTNYTYDEFGNLTQVTLPSGTVIEYVIDGANRRVGKKVGGSLTAGYLYQDQYKVIAELSSSGTGASRFVYGSKPNVPDYMIVGSDTYRIISDHLGSVRYVVHASSGSVAQAITYDEYGRVLSDTNPGFQPFGFAGGLYDYQTGLVRFGARDYDAEIGRWTSKDPIRFDGGENLYGYTFADPINWIDISGLRTEVFFHQPVGWGNSSAGHVAVDINGTTYTFGPHGMTVLSKVKHLTNNNFRNTIGVELNLSSSEEMALANYLGGYNGNYHALSNNCTNPVETGLSSLGYTIPDSLTPAGMANYINIYGIATHYYPATQPQNGTSAPWTGPIWDSITQQF